MRYWIPLLAPSVVALSIQACGPSWVPTTFAPRSGADPAESTSSADPNRSPVKLTVVVVDWETELFVQGTATARLIDGELEIGLLSGRDTTTCHYLYRVPFDPKAWRYEQLEGTRRVRLIVEHYRGLNDCASLFRPGLAELRLEFTNPHELSGFLHSVRSTR